MFWDIYIALCEKKNVKPTSVATSIGLSNAIPTKWKSGALPKSEILLKLASYFDVSIDYLLTGKEQQKSPASELTETEQECLDKFNNLVELDKGRILDRMETIYLSYSPEQKEKRLG